MDAWHDDWSQDRRTDRRKGGRIVGKEGREGVFGGGDVSKVKGPLQ